MQLFNCDLCQPKECYTRWFGYPISPIPMPIHEAKELEEFVVTRGGEGFGVESLLVRPIREGLPAGLVVQLSR